MTEIDEFLMSNAELIFCLFAAVLLLIHFRSKILIPMPILGILVVLVAFAFLVLYFRPEPIRLTLVGSVLVLYGTALFVILSDAMKLGLARFLTAKRGHN